MTIVGPLSGLCQSSVPDGQVFFGVGRAAVELAHRKRRRAPREFACPLERAAFLIDEQIDALLPLLPRIVVSEMLAAHHTVAYSGRHGPV